MIEDDSLWPREPARFYRMHRSSIKSSGICRHKTDICRLQWI